MGQIDSVSTRAEGEVIALTGTSQKIQAWQASANGQKLGGKEVKRLLGEIHAEMKANRALYSTDELATIKATCEKIAEKTWGREGTIGRRFWETVSNRDAAVSLKKINAELNKLTVLSFNMGASAADYELSLAANHKEINVYKAAEEQGMNPSSNQFIRLALDKAYFYADQVPKVVSEEEIKAYIQRAVEDRARDNKAIASKWQQNPAEKQELIHELEEIFIHKKGDISEKFLQAQSQDSKRVNFIAGHLCALLNSIGLSVADKMSKDPEVRMAEILTQKGNRADVFFLQEAVNKDRPLIKRQVNH